MTVHHQLTFSQGAQTAKKFDFFCIKRNWPQKKKKKKKKTPEDVCG